MSVLEEVSAKCGEIEEVKKASLESKKKLAEETKFLLAKSDEEKIAGFTNLLRLYMGEIDALSRRAKTSETFVQSLGSRVQAEIRKETESGISKVAETEKYLGEKMSHMRGTHENEISDLKRKLGVANGNLVAANEALEKQRGLLQEVGHEKDLEISYLRAELEISHSRRNSESADSHVHRALVEASDARAGDLEIACEKISGEKAAVEAKLKSLTADLQETRSREEEWKAEALSLKTEIRKMRESENSPEPVVEVPMLIEKHESVIGNLKQEISDRERRIHVLEREVLRLEEVSRTQPDRDVTVQAVSAAQTQRDRFRSRVLELEAERDDLRRALDRKNYTIHEDRRPAERNFSVVTFFLVNRRVQLGLLVYVVALHLLVLSSLARLTSVQAD